MAKIININSKLTRKYSEKKAKAAASRLMDQFATELVDEKSKSRWTMQHRGIIYCGGAGAYIVGFQGGYGGYGWDGDNFSEDYLDGFPTLSWGCDCWGEVSTLVRTSARGKVEEVGLVLNLIGVTWPGPLDYAWEEKLNALQKGDIVPISYLLGGDVSDENCFGFMDTTGQIALTGGDEKEVEEQGLLKVSKNMVVYYWEDEAFVFINAEHAQEFANCQVGSQRPVPAFGDLVEMIDETSLDAFERYQLAGFLLEQRSDRLEQLTVEDIKFLEGEVERHLKYCLNESTKWPVPAKECNAIRLGVVNTLSYGILFGQGRYDEAKELLSSYSSKVKGSHEEKVGARGNLAIIDFMQGNVQEAKKKFRKNLKDASARKDHKSEAVYFLAMIKMVDKEGFPHGITFSDATTENMCDFVEAVVDVVKEDLAQD